MICQSIQGFLFVAAVQSTAAFVPLSFGSRRTANPLFVSIGLGPDSERKEETTTLVEGVDYLVPNHEEFRTSRRSRIDEQCDAWFEKLLASNNDGVLGKLVTEARSLLITPVPLVNELEKPSDDPEWTPYVSTRLPWTPLTPAFGLEQFGLPIPRRNAETWRHFDVPGLVQQDYSGCVMNGGKELDGLSEGDVTAYRDKLRDVGGWLNDEECEARLVYINGRFVPQLSKSTNTAFNIQSLESVDKDVEEYLARLTDGFTDRLAAAVPNGQRMETSYKKLSSPDHNVGEPTSQFAINTQQGTACFAALNTIKTGAVAFVRCPSSHNYDSTDLLPILVINAITQSGGSDPTNDSGVSFHPRTLVIAEEKSRVSFVQSCVDLDVDADSHRPKLFNGYTQIFVAREANVTHSYLEESGGCVTADVEKRDEEFKEGEVLPREVEASRPSLKDSHLEAIDVHVTGEDASYEGTILSVGGSGRIRIAHSLTLLQSGCSGTINGFSLSGGAQRTDVKTNIHHVAQGTTSAQIQKNMIGGRATGAFRGRIRVEQSAQQTDSSQLSRTILLSDRARAWAVPSLEIIADDVKCSHGATISDLSEEELFYLRSRGLGRSMARNLLMYAFASDICSCVAPAMLGAVDSEAGLQKRVIRRLENVVPRGERLIKAEYQSI